MLQFCWWAVGEPRRVSYHRFFQHHHLVFDVEAGRHEFTDAVNRIFRRNGLAYELTSLGEVRRLAPPVLREALVVQRCSPTGDPQLDTKCWKRPGGSFSTRTRPCGAKLSRSSGMRGSASRRSSRDVTRKPGIRILLDKAAGPSRPLFRDVLEKDARAVTDIGNDFMIRHSETTKEPLTCSDQVDYLFHRLFALIRLVLRTTGRGG